LVELPAGCGANSGPPIPVFRLQGLSKISRPRRQEKESNVTTAQTIWLHRPESPALHEAQPHQTQRCGRAVFEVHHLTPTRVRIGVKGDVDATNRQALARFVEFHTCVSQQLVLDLRSVDFFGSQGFTALHYISVQCARRDVDWMILGNRMVHRILRVCDSDTVLPVVNNIDAALNKLDRCFKYRHSVSRSGLTIDSH
jgi:anti-anti-sigma factor